MKLKQLVLSIGLLSIASSAIAGSQYHRLVWDGSPSSTATIGFTPNGGQNHHVKYGTTTDDSTWAIKQVSATRTFDRDLTNSFVELEGLPANSAVYYQVCDNSGCGQKLWFKTAPTDNSPYVVVAGGDTRSGWTTRQDGNRLLAKIRPLFIMHGGDYTNSNTAYEMSEYLNDWQLTFSDDQIDGQSYKRIYPFIATHGNHEDDNYSTLCEVFGVDYNKDNQCNYNDTYGAFNISPLLRVYTLNSQFKNSGWSNEASAMNSWLSQDLANNGNLAQWRMAQYHKPMYPHYDGKSTNYELFDWWSDLFYSKAMNLVVESDTHINKITQALKPNGSGYSTATDGGTVFVGEGSWGAPARSANDPKSWTIDLDSIQQFKVITVAESGVVVRTAQFDSGSVTLSKAQRDADSVALPSGVNWWSAQQIGTELKLTKAASGLSVIDFGNTNPDPEPDPGTVVIANHEVVTGLAATKGNALSFSLAVVENAKDLKVEISGGSGDADLYVKYNQIPTLNSHDCRPYVAGNNEVCNIGAPSVGNYIIWIQSYADFSGVQLKASYTIDSGPGANPDPDPGEVTEYHNLSAITGTWLDYDFAVPAGSATLEVTISGGSGDADLYLKLGGQPGSKDYTCRPYQVGNSEQCVIQNPQAGQWHVGLKAYERFEGLTLKYKY